MNGSLRRPRAAPSAIRSSPRPCAGAAECGMGMKDPSVLENELLSEIAAAKDEAAVEAIRIAALGRSGSVSALLKTLGAMTPEQRRAPGPLVYRPPVREPPAEVGRVHPLSQVNDELIAIFADMGFSVAEGPDIESE